MGGYYKSILEAVNNKCEQYVHSKRSNIMDYSTVVTGIDDYLESFTGAQSTAVMAPSNAAAAPCTVKLSAVLPQINA